MGGVPVHLGVDGLRWQCTVARWKSCNDSRMPEQIVNIHRKRNTSRTENATYLVNPFFGGRE